MLEDGTFFARDYMVWEQVDEKDAKPKATQKEPVKRAPAATGPKNKQTQKTMAAFFKKQ